MVHFARQTSEGLNGANSSANGTRTTEKAADFFSGQVVVRKLNAGGAARERSYHAHQTCESPIYAHTQVGETLVCLPFKNGWEWWTRTLCLHAGGGGDCWGDYDKKVGNLDFLWWRHTPGEVAAVYRNHTIQKIKLVRNPLTRVLAAWLTWVSKKAKGTYNWVDEKFSDFVKHSMRRRTNCHWARQLRFCSEDEGLEYELYRVEERKTWGPQLLQRLGLLEDAKVAGGIRTVPHNHCPGHDCSATPLMLKYYTLELVQIVAEHFAEEIHRYNYTEQVRKWEVAVTNEDFEEHQTRRLGGGVAYLQARRGGGREAGWDVSASEAAEDLEALEAAVLGFGRDDS